MIDAQTRAPIAGAAVDIVSRDGVVFTDDDGKFAFTDVNTDTVTVRVRQLGYQEYSARHRVDPAAPVEIALEADPVVLEGIQVLGDRFGRGAADATVLASGKAHLQPYIIAR